MGIWGALRQVYPEAGEQRCWNHKIVNVLDKLPRRHQDAAKTLLCQIPYAPTQREATRRREQFVHWCHQHGTPDAARCLETDWDRLMAFYDFRSRTGNICAPQTPWSPPSQLPGYERTRPNAIER